MKKVIDANYFQAPALREYLSSSRKNFVVFNDYACMEAYKGNAVKSIYKSIETVSIFPRQIIVLKGTRDVVQLTLSAKDPLLFVDADQTQDFRDFCLGVRLAVEGDEELKAQIIVKGKTATTHLAAMRDDAFKIVAGILQLAKSFTPEHLRTLRKREILPAALVGKIVKEILLLAALLCLKHPDINQMPNADQIRDTYVFRFAVSVYLLCLRWISDGGPGAVRLEKLRNDMVDMNYVAYATFFDGLLTNDNKMNEIYGETCFVLESVFAMRSVT